MQRFIVNQFDANTFVVVDNKENREVCVCGNYDDRDDAEERAQRIVTLLNKNLEDIS